MATTKGSSRRGRLPDHERADREQAILDAAMAELLENGYEKVTMLAVAKRAGASKETLYSWFGSKLGLFQAVIERNGDRSAERVRAALHQGGSPREVLTGYCSGLLALLTGDASTALNRAAMANPDLAEVLLRAGRHRIGPLVEEYLSAIAADGVAFASDDDPGTAFQLLYGLAVRDTQIRVLLGERPPSKAVIRRRSTDAVERFLR